MKRGKKMILLLSALVLLLGGYALIGQMEGETTVVSETEGTFPLWSEEKTFASIAWENDGEHFAFEKGENVWMRTGDSAFPVNQTAVDNLAEKIACLTAVREMTDVQTPADYGLETPAFTVTVKDADGSEYVFAMGDETPFEDGYYLSVTGSDAVYVIESDLSTSFDKTLSQLATMEDIPETTNVTRMTVGDTLDIAYDETAQAWHDAATGEALDADEAETVVGDAAALTWSALVATSAADEQLTEWQLDDAQATRIALYNGETAERTLLIGAETEDGDRYARLPDSRMVYTVYGSDVEDVLAAGVDTLWQKDPLTLAADEIVSAKFVWDGGEAAFAAEDGESATAAGVYEQLAALEGTERVEVGVPGAQVLSAVVTDGEGAETELTLYAYSVDAYLLKITDTHGMLIDADDVDKLIRMLKQAG